MILNIVLFFHLYIYLEKNVNKFVGYGLFVINVLFEICNVTEIWVIKRGKDENNDLVGTVV